MSDLWVLTLADFLCSDVADKFSCGFNANLGLDLLNKGISIDLSFIKSLVHIVKCSISSISKLKNGLWYNISHALIDLDVEALLKMLSFESERLSGVENPAPGYVSCANAFYSIYVYILRSFIFN